MNEGKSKSSKANSRKSPAKLPFSFILEYLYPEEPVIKPMFGCFGLYVGKKIFFVVRKRNDHAHINGVWIATSREHHESLQKEFPSMRSIDVLGKDPTNWQVLPEASEDFEASVVRACELVKRGDKRIGVVPERKMRMESRGQC